MSDPSQQLDKKPLTKYGRAKLRKEERKVEEEEMMKEVRRLLGVCASAGSSYPQTPTQVAQPLLTPMTLEQPHPKLLKGKRKVGHAISAFKPERQANQHAGAASTSFVASVLPGQCQVSTVQTAIPISWDQVVEYPSHPIGAAASGSWTPQGGGGVRQGPPYVLASELRSPAINFGTWTGEPGVKDASGSGSGGTAGSVAQAASGGAKKPGVGKKKTPVKKPGVGKKKTPVKKPGVGQKKTPVKKPGVGQKKPGEAIPAASQPANKKQKTQGTEPDQSIDALNDVTAGSGVNLSEEEEQLLVGLAEESRTTEAMRKFAQEEEERLFLERGPLRAKVQAIAAKYGLSLSEDLERCLSLACEERLTAMLLNIIKYSKQRCDMEKDLHNTVVGFDPRGQVLLMKSRAKEAVEKKQAAENERLRKLNDKKDKGALADGDNEDLRLKVRKAQQEEDDKMRAKAANVAVRAAVGTTDMLSKWQMMAAQGLAKRQGGDTGDEGSGSREQEGLESGESGTTKGGGVRRIGAGAGGRQRPSIARKDVIALLERDPVMSKSLFLYRLYERRDRKGENARRL